MGAFDGLKIYGGYGGQCAARSHTYFKNQSAFSFFEGFGLPELKQLLSDAEKNDDNMIWVPQERRENGRIGLSIWYVRALIKENFENENSSSQ